VKAAVIGVGSVGRLVVDRLRLLNFDMTLCDPIRAQNEKDFHSTPLGELADLDFISLHVPLTMMGEHATCHFINKVFLQRQNKGCILLNASRGSVVHSQDLIDYGKPLSWCLDVWEHEPKIDKQILEQATIATPHIAGYSLQSRMRGIDMIYRVACEKNRIEAQPLAPIIVPHQQLGFSGRKYRWQEIVLSVFNPVVITDMMRTILMPAEDGGHSFDEMRHQFNYRHEFQYTRIVDANLSNEDILLLQQFGLKVV
jgi:erythronate-4-phosphate dehydrogenase